MKIQEVRITFEDGHQIHIDSYELEKLEKAYETITMLERAKQLYENLKPLFK